MQRYPIPVYTLSEFASYNNGLSTFARTEGAKDKTKRKSKVRSAVDATSNTIRGAGSALRNMPLGGKVAAGAGAAGLLGGAIMASKKINSQQGRVNLMKARNAVGGLGGSIKNKLGSLGTKSKIGLGLAGAGALAGAAYGGYKAVKSSKAKKAKQQAAAASQARESSERKKYGPAYGAVKAVRSRMGR